MTITDLIDAIETDGAARLGGLPRILVVDDDDMLLRSLGRVLRGRYDVQCESNPWRALVALEDDGPFDAVISDLTMPGVDGIDLLAQAHAEMPETPRILLTGNATLPSSIDAVNRAHVTTFLTKPIAPVDLIRTLDRAIATSGRSDGPQAGRTDHQVAQRDVVPASVTLANPTAQRLTERVSSIVDGFLGEHVRRDAWELATAARLCSLGRAAPGPDPTGPAVEHTDGTDAAPSVAACVPAFTEEALERLPRLHGVEQILRHHRNAAHPDAPIGAEVLFVAVSLVELEETGLDPLDVVSMLRADRVGFDTPVAVAVTDWYLATSADTGSTDAPGGTDPGPDTGSRVHAQLHLGETDEIIELFDDPED